MSWYVERDKSPMHLPSRGKVKAVDIGENHLKDFERAFSSRGQISRGEVDLQVVEI